MATKGLKGPILKVHDMAKVSTSQYTVLGEKKSDLKFQLTVRLGGTESSTVPKNPNALIRSTKDISQLQRANIVVPYSAIPMEARCAHLTFERGVCRSGCYVLEQARASECDYAAKAHPRAWMGNFDAKIRWDIEDGPLWLVLIGARDNRDGRLIILRSQGWENVVHPQVD